mmetsp:Transcript_35715/g.60853  ORF Transcript_35715/g.60853 Transcript_35715/m.60853 type:complete len:283 (-) Transcript_35715:340-1188(-)
MFILPRRTHGRNALHTGIGRIMIRFFRIVAKERIHVASIDVDGVALLVAVARVGLGIVRFDRFLLLLLFIVITRQIGFFFGRLVLALDLALRLFLFFGLIVIVLRIGGKVSYTSPVQSLAIASHGIHALVLEVLADIVLVLLGFGLGRGGTATRGTSSAATATASAAATAGVRRVLDAFRDLVIVADTGLRLLRTGVLKILVRIDRSTLVRTVGKQIGQRSSLGNSQQTLSFVFLLFGQELLGITLVRSPNGFAKGRTRGLGGLRGGGLGIFGRGCEGPSIF